MCWGVGDSFCVLGCVMTKPIAHVVGYHDGFPVLQHVDGAAVLPVGMALYTRPASDDTALLSEILNLLGPTAPTCCGCKAEWQMAIDLIKGRLG